MTLQQLKYIIALDKERHFARAAESCFVSQPGLTLQLKALEEEIGIKIFDRSIVPLKPTVLGETIIAKAKKVIQEVNAIRDFVIDEKNDLEGEIRIGIISTLSPYLIPLMITNIKRVLPKVNFIIKEADTFSLMKELEVGEIDLAIMSTPTGNKNLREFPVFNEPFVAYLNDSHPQIDLDYFNITEKDKENLLLLKDEYCFNAQLLGICNLENEKTIMRNFSFNINSIETLKNMVRANIGWSIIPELSIFNEGHNRNYKSFESPEPVREISLVVGHYFSKNLVLEKLKEIIGDCLPEKLKKSFHYKKVTWNDSPYFKNALTKKANT